MSAKNELLDEFDSLSKPMFSLDVHFLMTTLFVIAIFLGLLFPKIYLQSQIYYSSRDIAVMKREHNSLQEEQKILKAKVEKIKFKNQVLDTIF
ncbi:MAG: hypothetical protein GQ570_12220 [Helicobacteraceae bacterium]|nr:hypothetical protein [Helicobacteraceae bacterium]